MLRGLDEFLIGVWQAIQTEDECDDGELPSAGEVQLSLT